MEPHILDSIKRGHFAQAEVQLRKGAGGHQPHEITTLRAELAERLGKRETAARIATELLRESKLSPCLRSRCLILLGNIAFEDGRPQDAARILRESVSVAKANSCIEQLCWSELRLMSALFEIPPIDGALALLPELRRHVVQAGDPLLSAALHVFVSETEAKRGALNNARKHVLVAKSLLASYNNVWLDGLCGLAETAVAYFSGEMDSAHRSATYAALCASNSGHERTRLAAYIDLAHIYISQCDFRQAERSLSDAARLSQVSPRCRESLIETVAELELARGNTQRCKELIVGLLAINSPDASHQKLWAHHTLTRCLAAMGAWEEAKRVVNQGLERASVAGNGALVRLLSLLRAETHAVLRDPIAAAADIVEALQSQQDVSLELVGESQRVFARAFEREGDRLAAATFLVRSRRIFAAIGHLRAERDVERQSVQDNLDLPRIARDGESGRLDLLLTRLAAILQQASRADLLGAETMDLLLEAGVAHHAAVIVKHPSKAFTVERCAGWSVPEARAAAARVGDAVLRLGTWREAEWLLVADVRPGVSARAAWLAVQTVVSAGRELAAARLEAREREALWPLDSPDESLHGIFGSEQMVDLLRITRRIAATDVTVLITGETGVGKEVLARVLHDASPRVVKPFVPLNCSAVPREMLESHLFGHRRGAFTGADAAFPGVLRSAVGGTVFLDEIGEVSLDLQPKLLRFLESGEVHPLGEPQPVRVNVRVIAATNQDLERMVLEGRFREDLYYRLNVINLKVPPLRERREEILLLVSHFLERFAREFNKGRLRIADETMEYFILYSWPGNVRQLANELRRLVALAEPDAVLMPEHLSPMLVAARRTRPASERELLPTELVVRLDQPLAAATEHLERAIIHHAMTICHGRVDQVAKALGLSRKGLYLKRRRLRLDAFVS